MTLVNQGSTRTIKDRLPVLIATGAPSRLTQDRARAQYVEPALSKPRQGPAPVFPAHQDSFRPPQGCRYAVFARGGSTNPCKAPVFAACARQALPKQAAVKARARHASPETGNPIQGTCSVLLASQGSISPYLGHPRASSVWQGRTTQSSGRAAQPRVWPARQEHTGFRLDTPRVSGALRGNILTFRGGYNVLRAIQDCTRQARAALCAWSAPQGNLESRWGGNLILCARAAGLGPTMTEAGFPRASPALRVPTRL